MPSIIFKIKFRSPDEQRSFTEEIEYSTQEYKQESIKGLKHEDYIDKDDVDFTKVIDYSTESYKQKTEKYIKENNNYTFSNFSNNIDKDAVEIIKKRFAQAQENGSFLYKTYISFEDGYLEKNNIINNGIVNENLLKTTVRNSMIKLLNNENLKDYTFLGNIHYDTDNIHLHVYIVENGTPTRKINYDAKTEKEKYKNAKFKVTSFKKAKSEIHNSLNKDYENLKEIQNIFRDKILKTNINFKTFSKNELEELKNIYNKLPANKNLWQFNNKRIKHIKPQLKEFTKNYLKNYHTENFDKLNKVLDKQEKEFTRIYGQQRNYIFKNKVSNNYKKHKLEDIYSRTANRILKELKEIDLSTVSRDKKIKKLSFSNIKFKKILSLKEKNNTKNKTKTNRIDKQNLVKNNKKFNFKDYTKYINRSKKNKINTRSALRIFRSLTRNTDKNLRKEMMHNMREYQKLIQKIDYKSKNLDQSID